MRPRHHRTNRPLSICIICTSTDGDLNRFLGTTASCIPGPLISDTCGLLSDSPWPSNFLNWLGLRPLQSDHSGRRPSRIEKTFYCADVKCSYTIGGPRQVPVRQLRWFGFRAVVLTVIWCRKFKSQGESPNDLRFGRHAFIGAIYMRSLWPRACCAMVPNLTLYWLRSLVAVGDRTSHEPPVLRTPG